MSRHGPKPGRHEAEAFSILEAEAFTDFILEAEALATKLKPAYLYSTKRLVCKVEALVNHEAEVFENHEAEARLSKI